VIPAVAPYSHLQLGGMLLLLCHHSQALAAVHVQLVSQCHVLRLFGLDLAFVFSSSTSSIGSNSSRCRSKQQNSSDSSSGSSSRSPRSVR